VSFEDIADADKIGIELPDSAKQHRTWWGNEATPTSRQCRAWLDAGWDVSAVNFTAGYVAFRRHD
jgi:hypothetical protein